MLMASGKSFANSPFGPVEIDSIIVHDAKMLVITIKPDGGIKHTESCDVGRENNLVINQDSPYQKEMFAIALAAKSQGKKISGWVNGCHQFWSYKAPKLTLISFSE